MAAILKQLFSKYLIITNTVTSGTLLGLGDVITQNLEIEYASRMGNTSHDYDVRRTGRMFLMGLMIGPLGHFWYTKLADKLVIGTGPKVVLKKIGVDQIIFTPIITCIFFGGMGLLEGKDVKGAVNEIKNNFIAVYSVDCCVWPPAQYINFHLIPARFRSVYVSSMTLCWNTFLSYMKHRDMTTE
uniref:Mpv17-like protein 2 n=1 Tax=Crassostrea virginica TaxID=6565 RepID=A0A8B8CKU6_CRAVI|nr:mpv17-like protein 2 [Crassostrea virginica]